MHHEVSTISQPNATFGATEADQNRARPRSSRQTPPQPSPRVIITNAAVANTSPGRTTSNRPSFNDAVGSSNFHKREPRPPRRYDSSRNRAPGIASAGHFFGLKIATIKSMKSPKSHPNRVYLCGSAVFGAVRCGL